MIILSVFLFFLTSDNRRFAVLSRGVPTITSVCVCVCVATKLFRVEKLTSMKQTNYHHQSSSNPPQYLLSGEIVKERIAFDKTRSCTYPPLRGWGNSLCLQKDFVKKKETTKKNPFKKLK
jgi:hypothetical protein